MILCLGLTPALQRTLIFRSMPLNEVNRVKQVIISAAGKSLNTAKALAALGVECKVAGFNGGHNGELIKGFLNEYGVDSALTAMASETRICTTLIDERNGTVTELVEEAPQPSAGEIENFIRENVTLLQESQMLLISGTLPPYAPDDFYRHFTVAAAEADIPVVIDSHKAALLAVLQDKPLMVRLNLSELETTFECKTESEADIVELMCRLISAGAQSVLVTKGRETTYLLDGDQLLKFTPPEVEHHISPIGSGDCTNAGIACGLINGDPLRDAVKLGLACGSANVESLIPAVITRARVMQLLR